MNGLQLWATEAQLCWGSSDKLCGTCLRIIPLGDREVAAFVLIPIPHSLRLPPWMATHPQLWVAPTRGRECSQETNGDAGS